MRDVLADLVHQVKELSIDYTNCDVESPLVDANFKPGDVDNTAEMKDDRVVAHLGMEMKPKPRWGHFEEMYEYPSGHRNLTKFCVLVFTIPQKIDAPVLFYYRLDNFYQNHRRYVKSFDTNQLKGDAVNSADIGSGECDPLSNQYHPNDPDKRPIYPCGLIANSMFNDTFSDLNTSRLEDGSNDRYVPYKFERTGIIWDTEADLYGETKYQPKDIRPPPNWVNQYPEGGYDNLNHSQLPNLHTDEAFQVWMRTAGLPYFSKLAQRNNDDPLMPDTYRLKIRDRMIFEPAA